MGILTPRVPPYPRTDAIANERGKLSQPYQDWLDQGLIPRLNMMPVLTGRLIADGTAAFGATPLAEFDNAGGHYEISYALRVLTAATTSSGVSLTISWTENGLARSKTTANLVANTTAQNDTGAFIIQTDPNTPVTASVAYVSVGATPMRYRASVYAKRLPS